MSIFPLLYIMKNWQILFLLSTTILTMVIATQRRVIERATKLIINENVPYSPTNPHPSHGPIATRTKNYIDLVSKSRVSIDKTLLIETVLNFPWEVMLLTYPAQWGRTTDMLMIRDFLQIPVKEDGTRIPLEESEIYQFYTNAVLPGNKILKEKLLIAHNQTLLDAYLGQYVVIHISFHNTSGTDKETFMQSLANSISGAYREHSYMIRFIRNDRSSGAREYCELIETFLSMPYTVIDEERIRLSLHWLSDMLYEHYKKPIYVLIDNYDVPINHVLLHPNFDKTKRDEATEFYHHVLSWVLKGNARVRMSLMIGSYKLFRPMIRRLMGYITDHNYLEHRFCGYYGMNEYDFNDTCDYLSIPADRKSQIEAWYGSKVGPNSTMKKINPYGLAKHLETGKFQDFREKEDRNIMDILLPLFLRHHEFMERYLPLLNGYTTGILASEFSDFDITYERSVANPQYKLKIALGVEVDDALRLMLFAGFVNMNTDPVEKAKINFRAHLLRVANLQMRARMRTIFERFLESLNKGLKSHLENLVRSFKAFATDDRTTSPEWEKAVTEFLHHLPIFESGQFGDMGVNDTIRVYSNNYGLVHALPHWIMALTEFTDFHRDICELEVYGTTYQLEIFVFNNRAVVYEFKFHNETSILEKTSSYNEIDDQPKFSVLISDKYENVNQVKFIAAHVYQNKTTQVFGEMIPMRKGELVMEMGLDKRIKSEEKFAW